MSITKSILLLVLAVLILLEAYVRLAPSDPKLWHVDPLKAQPTKTPNSFLVRPGEGKYPAPEFGVNAATLAREFDDLLMADANVVRLAGSVADLYVTYVVRSRLVGFPDYVSVRFIPLTANRSSIAIFSRARFGYSDQGVNRRRVLAWFKALAVQ